MESKLGSKKLIEEEFFVVESITYSTTKDVDRSFKPISFRMMHFIILLQIHLILHLNLKV